MQQASTSKSYPKQLVVWTVSLIGITFNPCSQFFGKPSGSKPPIQQTKLSFASRAADKSRKQGAIKKETEDEDGNQVEGTEVAPSSQRSASSASAKENSDPVQGEGVRSEAWGKRGAHG